jgi:hypothetical protein
VTNGRGGLGSPTLVATANSASGYIQYTLSGFPAGTFTIQWDYIKDVSIDAGFDTVWIDNVTFPDGTTEDFETCSSLPSGWTTSGDASWRAVDDGTRASSAWGGHCSIQAGSIDHDETSSVSVTKTFATGGDLSFFVWPSSESESLTGEGPITGSCYDYLGLTVNGTPQSVSLCGTYCNQNSPLQDGVVAYPANLSETIAVGAATNFDRRSDYSQWGPEIDVVCQSNGGSLGITTTDVTGSNGYSTGDYTSGFGGTSSAAPLCSGIAALALSADPTLTADQVRSLMQSNTRKIGFVPYTAGWNPTYGYGAVNGSEVIAAAAAEGSIRVEKQTIPDGDSSSFNFSGTLAGTIGDGEQIKVITSPGAYATAETVPPGWTLIGIRCDDDDSSGSLDNATATFNLSASESVSCVFTNCADTHSIVDLSGQTITGTEAHSACDTLTAESVTVTSTGNLRLQAGRRIVLGSGFSVGQGGSLTADVFGAP